MTTDTPRTDAVEFRHCPPQPEAMLKKHEDSYALSRQLERELAASQAKVGRLRKYVEKMEIYSPANEWSQPEWRKLIGSKEEDEDPETLFKLYQFRIAPAPEEQQTPANCREREAHRKTREELRGEIAWRRAEIADS